MAWTQEKINFAYAEIQRRSTTDKTFREMVLSDPSTAIKEVTGEEVPAGLNIKVIESDPAYNATFVLPDLLSDELNDDELDKVAGGLSILGIGSSSAGACAGAISIGNCGAHACAGDVEVK